MVFFHTKNRNLGIFWRPLELKMFIHFRVIGNILRLFDIFCGHLVYFVAIWYIFPCFGMFYQEKSGNPDVKPECSAAVAESFHRLRDNHIR
jgi:hypothetical protein